MDDHSLLDERSSYSSYEIRLQKLKDRRDSLAKHFHDLKASRETSINEPVDSKVKQRRYSSRKMKRSQSTESVSRRQNDSTSSDTILLKAISQLLQKKKEQERSTLSIEVDRSESREAFSTMRHRRSSSMYDEHKPMPRQCRSMDHPVERGRFLEGGIPSTISSRPTNVSINKAIIQLLEKKQSMDMSINQDHHRNQRSKLSSLLLAGYLRKAVPSLIGEWITMYVQVTPGLLTMSDCYGRSKQKVCLSTSTIICRAVKVTENIMKMLSKAGENIHEVAFFEIKSIGSVGGLSRLWMTNTSVERDAWLAAIEEAMTDDESVSDLSSSEMMI